MARGGVCTAALAMAVLCITIISAAEAGRTHEFFAQSTYDDGTSNPTSVLTGQKAAGAMADPLNDFDNKFAEKTATAATTTTGTSAQSTLTDSQDAQVGTVAGGIQDPESATPQPSASFVNIPFQQQEQHDREYMGATPEQGEFGPDARPWWSNPQNENYNNNVQGKQSQLDSSEPVPNTANRYPMGYPHQYSSPQFYTSQNSQPSSGAQYSAMSQQQQYSQSNGFPHYTGNIPIEMTGGGCPTQYWIHNTQRWPAFFTVKTTVGEALGTPAAKVFGQVTLLQALLNTRPDGYTTLLRSAAAAILNSYSRSHYKFSHVEVIELFAKALESSQTAAKQAAAFEEANVSSYMEQYNSCF
ncbi:unnamed protein product [Calypogeia fissa]